MSTKTQMPRCPPLRFDGIVNKLRKERDINRELDEAMEELRQKAYWDNQKLAICRREIKRLRVCLFWSRYNTSNLRRLMERINKEIVRCDCAACHETGRAPHITSGARPSVPCQFCQYWEELLRKYRIPFEYVIFDSGARLPYKMRKDSGACIERESAIVNVGKDDLWRDVAYGTPVSQQDNDPDSAICSKIRALFQYIEDSQVDSEAESDDSLDSQDVSDGVSDVF